MSSNLNLLWLVGAAVALVWLVFRLPRRLRLSRAKQPSLAGHFRIARRVTRVIRDYEFSDDRFFSCDDAPGRIADMRRDGLDRLSARLSQMAPLTLENGASLGESVSDVGFVNAHRVPFPFRRIVQARLPIGGLAEASEGTRIRDLDGNWFQDVGGSYGVNVFGYDFYKSCIEAAAVDAGELGPVLGPFHPAMKEVVRRLQAISGLDQVSFHMSGTEAVMQAVRLARFNTRRTHLVMFSGAYHGWWDGVQPTLGNERRIDDIYVLREMSDATLRVIRERKDIACVLVNPIQAMHANSPAPGDGMLVDSSRGASVNVEAYGNWLRELRSACDENGVALIFDEVFVGFRLAKGGAQAYFGVTADMVTYGKTLAGGLPVGVVCGKRELMQRDRAGRPTQICFARGTFNSHPYVVCAMREFLRRIDKPEISDTYASLDRTWNDRAGRLNERLKAEGLPIRVVNLTSVFTFVYLVPSRYNWMLQFYLRAERLALSWVGTGRLIFSHNYTEADFAVVADAIIAAAARMRDDGWWWEAPGVTNRSIRFRLLGEMWRALWAPAT